MKKPSHIPNTIRQGLDVADMRAKLLDRYDTQGRTLPWRIRPEDRAAGLVPDPYAIWLSEIMSQQTTIAHAAPYWQRFLDEFPSVCDLARAERDQVLTMWAGLGYYARARNLHKCAGIVCHEFGGVFPKDEAGLLKLPGVGPYTAATIAAICYDEPTNIVDGNVERVISRVFAVQTQLPKGKKNIRDAAALLIRPDRCGDYGQALMDLGGNVCVPKNPKCDMCPWQEYCAAYKAGNAETYPRKAPKKTQPVRYGAVFVLRCGDEVLLERRPDTGLLGGMMGFVGTEWGTPPQTPLESAPQTRNWEKLGGQVKHVFTHFDLRLTVYTAQTNDYHIRAGFEPVWAQLEAIEDYALPTVFKKVLAHALSGETLDSTP